MNNRYNKTLSVLDDSQIEIRYYKRPLYGSIPVSINDLYVITTVGDRLDNLAYQFYNNSAYYWVIAQANPNIINKASLFLPEGVQIRIPSNPEVIAERLQYT
jgi:phage tail protein X